MNITNTVITIKQNIIKMVFNAQSGHLAGALGMADVFVALHYNIIKHDPTNPTWEERDRVVLSNGHICPVLYATLASLNYFPVKQLTTFRKLDSKLQGHPHYLPSLGIENTSGPLGQGLSQSVGMALAFKMEQKKNRVYCIVSDGEQDEGQIWEAYMLASARKLDNLTVLIDRNNIQLSGFTKDILPLASLKEKLLAFNWFVLEVDGHNHQEIVNACLTAKEIKNQPTVIICHTVPGKGVKFMENSSKWHGKVPSKTQAIQAIKELETQKERNEQ